MRWSIDGKTWSLPCNVERTAEIRASEISGLMLNKNYFNDVVGTYLQYTIRIEVPFGREAEYNELYDDYLAEPVGSHTFRLPYAGGLVTVEGMINNISDVYVRVSEFVGNTKKEVPHWKGIQFTVTGIHPTKEVDELDNVINRGFPSIPSSTSVSAGTVYIYSGGQWVELEDANNYSF